MGCSPYNLQFYSNLDSAHLGANDLEKSRSPPSSSPNLKNTTRTQLKREKRREDTQNSPHISKNRALNDKYWHPKRFSHEKAGVSSGKGKPNPQPIKTKTKEDLQLFSAAFATPTVKGVETAFKSNTPFAQRASTPVSHQEDSNIDCYGSCEIE